MQKAAIFVIVILILLLGYFGTRNYFDFKDTSKRIENTPQKTKSSPAPTDIPLMSNVVTNLEIPWALAFLPDGSILFTERVGRVRLIDKDGQLASQPIATINIKQIGEGGLLGIVLHPNFSSNHYIYLYYTYSGSGNNTLNKVIRMKFIDKKLTDEKIILDNIPGSSNHNGGRIKFGPDNLLYIGTGDAENPSQAQNTDILGGKILRVTDEGKIPPENKFGNPVYSYGHRNVQGLAWNSQGVLFATEHGRSGAFSGLDEINIIESGKNYGWPIIQGDEKRAGMETPVKNSGPTVTWAPSGAAFLGNSLFFAGLRGQTLYEAVTTNNQVTELKEHFKGQLGRIREVIIGPDKMIYISTSNRDGRGTPAADDDKIIKINPGKF